MKSVFLIAALTFALKHSLQIMQFSALIHLFIYTSICIYSFALFRRTHTRTSHEQRAGEKLKMQTKCTIYIHLHNSCDFFLLCIYYFLFSFIINDARFWIHINGESPFVLCLSCCKMCADKIQISICALTTHTHSHTQHTHTLTHI